MKTDDSGCQENRFSQKQRNHIVLTLQLDLFYNILGGMMPQEERKNENPYSDRR